MLKVFLARDESGAVCEAVKSKKIKNPLIQRSFQVLYKEYVHVYACNTSHHMLFKALLSEIAQL